MGNAAYAPAPTQDEMQLQTLGNETGVYGAIAREAHRTLPEGTPLEWDVMRLQDDILAIPVEFRDTFIHPAPYTAPFTLPDVPQHEQRLGLLSTDVAVALLEEDDDLKQLRFERVPRFMSEGTFWQLYSCLVLQRARDEILRQARARTESAE